MKRHPRRSDEEWLNIIKECRTSGLPDKTWCLDHGIQLEISNHAERETIANAIAVLQCLC